MFSGRAKASWQSTISTTWSSASATWTAPSRTSGMSIPFQCLFSHVSLETELLKGLLWFIRRWTVVKRYFNRAGTCCYFIVLLGHGASQQAEFLIDNVFSKTVRRGYDCISFWSMRGTLVVGHKKQHQDWPKVKPATCFFRVSCGSVVKRLIISTGSSSTKGPLAQTVSME